ncbi:hypothetical protein [Anaerotruncus rubiinfantis]|uniref:hypothetical protein n=1 Tax=Anaerotruncus rubiinfantis TaxID=1720200 RepID=UPI003D790299
MRYRKLTETGDYSFGNGSLDYISGVATIAQAVKTRIMLFLAEWWEDQEDGLPLFEDILGGRATNEELQDVDRIIIERIEGTQGIASVEEYESSYENRKYTFSATVITTDGETVSVEGGV